MNRILITENDMLSSLAFWAISQCPTHIPRKFEIVLKTFKEEIRKKFDDYDKDFYYYDFDSQIEIEKWLYETLFKIEEFKQWNLSENEFNNGISIDNPNRKNMALESSYDVIDPKDNFIDLNALVRNMSKHLVEISESFKI